NQVLNSERELDVAGRRILDFVEFARKAVEIVDRRRLFIAGDESAVCEPMGGHHEDRSWSRNELRQRAEPAAPLIVLDGVERRSVSDEQDRHTRGLFNRGLNGFNGWAQQIGFEFAHPLNPFTPWLK